MDENGFEYFEPSVTVVDYPDPIDQIAAIAHSCYAVGPKDHASNVTFVKSLIQMRHLSMVEHSVFAIQVSLAQPVAYKDLMTLLLMTQYVNVDVFQSENGLNVAVSYSMRPLIELLDQSKDLALENTIFQAMVDNLPYECQALLPLPKNSSVNPAIPYLRMIMTNPANKALWDRHLFIELGVTTDRGVTHELVRHRECSFAQESTRYCNYSKQKFGKKIGIIKPLDYQGREKEYDDAFNEAAKAYMDLIAKGAKAQEARAVLPNALKTHIVIGAYLGEWKHILSLRLAPDAHPEAQRVARLMKAQLDPWLR